jgi:hypothetical protein
MSTAALATWAIVTADAGRHRGRVLEELRSWAALQHAASRGGPLPGHWHAAHGTAARPARTRLVAIDDTGSDRDRAEAAADDLWDAVAEAWGFVKWARGHRPPPAPGLEHLLAELAAAGRWLADYPVTVAAHDAALAALFLPAEGSAA